MLTNNKYVQIGCTLCILGSSIIVIHAPKEGEVKTIQELNEKIVQSGTGQNILFIVKSDFP